MVAPLEPALILSKCAPYKSFLLVIPSGLQPTRNLLFGLFQQPLKPCPFKTSRPRLHTPSSNRGFSVRRSGLLTPADEMHNLQPVAVVELSLRPLRPRDDLAIEFYRDAIAL